MINDSVIHYDVIIVGAGPAGTSCAMALNGSGLNILLLDKASFPRDKICGDAIAGRSIKTLDKFAPALVKEIRGFGMKELILNTCVFIDHNKPFKIYWKNETYCIKRYDFDALLLKHALKNDLLTFKPNFKVDHVAEHENKILIGNKKTDTYYSANILVAADGSQSFLAKQLIDLKLDPAHFSAAVRAYYSNVEGIVPHQTELHIYKENLPGFLWIFPLSKTQVNVGFGMLSSEISKRNINLKQRFTHIISQHPQLKDRFQDADLEGEVKGFGLALASRQTELCGNNFLLLGDAASLIDPKSGDGISNAIESGYMAAKTIVNAHKINNFNKDTLKQYEAELNKKLRKELFISTLMLRFVTYLPTTFRVITPILMKSKWMAKLAGRI